MWKRHLFVEYSVTNQRIHWILHTHFLSSFTFFYNKPSFFSLANLKQRVTIIELPLKRVNDAFMFSFLVLSFSLFVSLYVCQGLSVSLTFRQSVFLSVCLSVSLSVCLSASLSFYQLVFFVSLYFVRLSFCQFFFMTRI